MCKLGVVAGVPEVPLQATSVGNLLRESMVESARNGYETESPGARVAILVSRPTKGPEPDAPRT